MKKNILVALLLVFVVFMSSCGSNSSQAAETAYQMYEKGNAEISSADSVEMKMEMLMNMKMGEENVDMEMSGIAKQITKGETDLEMEMTFNTKFSGEEMQMQAFYKDGMYYMQTAGQKMKMEMDMSEALEQSNTSMIAFPESSVKDQKVTAEGTGKKLEFTLEASALEEILDQQMSSLTQMMGEGTNITFGDIKFEALIDDKGAIKTTNLIFTAVIEAEGEKVDVDYNIGIEILKIGGITIEFPTDLDEYQDITVQ